MLQPDRHTRRKKLTVLKLGERQDSGGGSVEFHWNYPYLLMVFINAIIFFSIEIDEDSIVHHSFENICI